LAAPDHTSDATQIDSEVRATKFANSGSADGGQVNNWGRSYQTINEQEVLSESLRHARY